MRSQTSQRAIVAQSARLILRRFDESDAEAFYQLNADPEVIRFTGDSAFESPKLAQEFIRSYTHYDQFGFGRWAVEMKESGCFVGFCGLRFCELTAEIDLGFRVCRRFWRQGIATESSQLALSVGFNDYQLDSVIGRAKTENLASHGVLKKLGFVPDMPLSENDTEWIQYRLKRPQLV